MVQSVCFFYPLQWEQRTSLQGRGPQVAFRRATTPLHIVGLEDSEEGALFDTVLTHTQSPEARILEA